MEQERFVQFWVEQAFFGWDKKCLGGIRGEMGGPPGGLGDLMEYPLRERGIQGPSPRIIFKILVHNGEF